MQDFTTLTDIVLEKLTTIFVVINNDGQIEFVSPSVKKILGYEPYNLLGEGWYNLTRNNPEERGKVKSFIGGLLAHPSESTRSFEHLLKTAAGGYKWILWNSSTGPEGSLVVVGTDITERKNTEQQLAQRNRELQARNTEMLDSITYATRIQQAILPEIQSIKKSFKEAFVLYKPKDLVSGDFYWHYERGNKTFVAAVDCTGHGVPGALMSIIANSILKGIVVKGGADNPQEILHLLDQELALALTKEDGITMSDGMDISLCVFDKGTQTLEFAGAFRPLILVRNGEITEYKGSRYPIGFYKDIPKEFQSIEIPLEPDDSFYLFSDGYIDQFGGEQGKKLNKARFKELLLMVQSMEMDEQEAFLDYSLLNWQQGEEQTDDVLVIGLKW